MVWRVEIAESAAKEIRKLDRRVQTLVLRFLREKISDDPRQTGKALKGEFADLWRYRVGDYRIIARIEDRAVTILVLRVGHRKEIYR